MPPESSNQLPRKTRLVLVDLLAHASAAARIIGHSDDSDDSNLEQLSDHVDALVHGLSELFGDQRLTGKPAPSGDEADVVDELRQFMARADALASTRTISSAASSFSRMETTVEASRIWLTSSR